MTKAEIVNEISKKTGIDKTTALTSVEAFMEVVKDSLAEGENVYLRGFGSFILKNVHRKQRAIFQKTQLSLFPSTTSRHSSPPRRL